METNLLGHDEEDCGFEIFDQKGNRHTLQVAWDGEINFHGVDDYPHDSDEWTEEQRRIMSQVEYRARYAAQREFPEEDILTHNWDPHHYVDAIAAFNNYPMEEFLEDFYEYYRALEDPTRFIDDPELDPDTPTCTTIVHFDETVKDVSDVIVEYSREDGSDHMIGEVPDYPGKKVVLTMPWLDFADDFDYEEQMPDVIMSHLMAHVRDAFLHMGEDPPEEYRVEGIGKLDILADR